MILILHFSICKCLFPGPNSIFAIGPYRDETSSFSTCFLNLHHEPSTLLPLLPSGTFASTTPSSPEEAKKPKLSILPEDCTIIDVDEYKAANDLPLPMFTKLTEVEIEEVEMEDVLPDPIIDIDSCDSNNPLAVVEYIKDIYSYYRKTE
ncbi:hypothetical protein IFM89_029985, partial [Coptis chinensis]